MRLYQTLRMQVSCMAADYVLWKPRSQSVMSWGSVGFQCRGSAAAVISPRGRGKPRRLALMWTNKQLQALAADRQLRLL